MKFYLQNFAWAAFAAALFLGCADIPDDLRNEGEGKCDGDDYHNYGCPGYSGGYDENSGLICAAHWNSFRLSYAGEPYANVDGKETFSQAKIADNGEKADLVAYHANNAGDYVYSPRFASIEQDSLARIFRSWASLLDGVADDSDTGVEKISIKIGAVFYLESTESNMYKISVIGAGGASVILNAEKCFPR